MGTSSKKSNREKRLQEMLLRKKKEIETRVTEELGVKMTEDISSTLGPAMDEGDLSNLEAGRDLDYGLLTMYTQTLKNIEHALERLDDGTYGTCEECGTEIVEKRLQVMPFARYCVDCQKEKERFAEADKGRNWMERRAQVERTQSDEDEYS